MSGTFLGNQARQGYGGDDERLKSAVSLSASLVYLFKTRRIYLEVKF